MFVFPLVGMFKLIFPLPTFLLCAGLQLNVWLRSEIYRSLFRQEKEKHSCSFNTLFGQKYKKINLKKGSHSGYFCVVR